MMQDDIPNPVPAWVEARAGSLTSHAAPSRSPPRGRRPEGGRRPPERHFPGFDAAPPPELYEESPEPVIEPPPAPVPELPVEQIVEAAVASALEQAQAGLLMVDRLLTERARLIAFRPTVDEAMRELKQDKPDYWRERRAWLLVVRGQVHNRLHIINHQIGALNRAVASTSAPEPSTAPPATEA